MTWEGIVRGEGNGGSRSLRRRLLPKHSSDASSSLSPFVVADTSFCYQCNANSRHVESERGRRAASNPPLPPCGMTRLCALYLAAYFHVFANGESYYQVKDTRYEPDWESLDTRPLPRWYDDAKLGIFIHWGVYSVPSFGTEWFWSNWKITNRTEYVRFMKKNYPPNFTYQDFARDFTAEFFDPHHWADLFEDSGARYVVLTSKHHEGYTLWPSKNSFSWNAKDVGPNRDLVGELAQAMKNHTSLRFGLYHSLYEWFNPLYIKDKEGEFKTCNFVWAKAKPELYDLVTTYEPQILWSDGDWEAPDTYWGSEEFLAWLYNDSPVRETVVTNDRWGIGTLCKHGDFYTCADRYSPGVLQTHKWENCLTIDKRSWGYRRNAQLAEYMTIEELVEELVKTVSCGGNMLMNVGPTKDGIITPIYEERLRQMGSWMRINGEAIYYSRPWTYQNDTETQGVWYTKKGNHVYACILFWPKGDYLFLGAPELTLHSTIELLGHTGGQLRWDTVESKLRIRMPSLSEVSSSWAYVLKISNVYN